VTKTQSDFEERLRLWLRHSQGALQPVQSVTETGVDPIKWTVRGLARCELAAKRAPFTFSGLFSDYGSGNGSGSSATRRGSAPAHTRPRAGSARTQYGSSYHLNNQNLNGVLKMQGIERSQGGRGAEGGSTSNRTFEVFKAEVVRVSFLLRMQLLGPT